MKEVKGKPSTEKNKENMIEWITGQHTVTATYTDPKFVNRIKKIYEERKDEFKGFYLNSDGSVCATFPKKWLKNNPGSLPTTDKPKRTMTDEQKKALAERLAKGRAAKKGE